jgi:hypothetical protein
VNAHFSLFTLASYLIGGRPQSGWPSEPNAVGNGRIIPICGGHHRARAIVLVAPVCRPITSEIPDDDEPIQTCISSRLYVHTHTLMMFVLISSYFFFSFSDRAVHLHSIGFFENDYSSGRLCDLFSFFPPFLISPNDYEKCSCQRATLP